MAWLEVEPDWRIVPAMHPLSLMDWSWIAGFLAVALALAIYHARDASKSIFFNSTSTIPGSRALVLLYNLRALG